MKVAVGLRRVAAGKRTSGRCPTQIAAKVVPKLKYANDENLEKDAQKC